MLKERPIRHETPNLGTQKLNVPSQRFYIRGAQRNRKTNPWNQSTLRLIRVRRWRGWVWNKFLPLMSFTSLIVYPLSSSLSKIAGILLDYFIFLCLIDKANLEKRKNPSILIMSQSYLRWTLAWNFI